MYIFVICVVVHCIFNTCVSICISNLRTVSVNTTMVCWAVKLVDFYVLFVDEHAICANHLQYALLCNMQKCTVISFARSSLLTS